MRQAVNLAGAALLFLCNAAPADEAQLARGEYLVHAGGCLSCHTGDGDGAVPLAGGHALETPFGTFHVPNITPDRESGIGDWSDEDFLRAFWEGENPDGDAYYPAFPYTAYTGLSRDDLLAIKAYLFSLEPVRNAVPEHDLAWYVSMRTAASAWKWWYFTPGRFAPDAAQSEQWNRGAYLVRHLGHCGECHTPRGAMGALLEEQAFAGTPDGPGGEYVPNITPHPEDGIGRWSASDIEYFLDAGMVPDGDFAGGSMGPVIEDNTSRLTRDDRMAIATYLKALPALPDAE